MTPFRLISQALFYLRTYYIMTYRKNQLIYQRFQKKICLPSCPFDFLSSYHTKYQFAENFLPHFLTLFLLVFQSLVLKSKQPIQPKHDFTEIYTLPKKSIQNLYIKPLDYQGLPRLCIDCIDSQNKIYTLLISDSHSFRGCCLDCTDFFQTIYMYTTLLFALKAF